MINIEKWLQTYPNKGEQLQMIKSLEEEQKRLEDLIVEYSRENSNLAYDYIKSKGIPTQHTDWTSKDQAKYHDNNKRKDQLKKDLRQIKKDIKAVKNYNPPKQLSLLGESLEKLSSDIYATKSSYDIMNLLKNKPKNYKIVWDENIHYYLIGDGSSYVHGQILEAAMQQGLYHELNLTTQSQINDYMIFEMDEDQVAFLCFYPEDNESIDKDRFEDGYPFKYYYPFGILYSRFNRKLDETPLYEVLGPCDDMTILEEHLLESKEIKMNEKLIKHVITPQVDEMEDETGLKSFEDLLKELRKSNESFNECYVATEDLYTSATDALYNDDEDDYRKLIRKIKEEGKLNDYLNWCNLTLGLDKQEVEENLPIDECDGGVANAGGFTAQAGTAPTVTGTTFLGQPVEGKSVKHRIKKKHYTEIK